jgi:hypothetical protein
MGLQKKGTHSLVSHVFTLLPLEQDEDSSNHLVVFFPGILADHPGRLKLNGCIPNEPEQDRHGFPPKFQQNFSKP